MMSSWCKLDKNRIKAHKVIVLLARKYYVTIGRFVYRREAQLTDDGANCTFFCYRQYRQYRCFVYETRYLKEIIYIG